MYYNGRAYVNRGRNELQPGNFRIVEIVSVDGHRVGLAGRYETRKAANEAMRTRYRDRNCVIVEEIPQG